jgi:2'-5' RNA ligase superfamily
MEKPANSTIINICVIPGNAVSEACVSISQSLETDGTLFVLGDGKFAHMTVYMARFANDALDKVADAAGQALRSTSSFRCIHSGYFMTEGRYLEVSYRKSQDFMALHETLINSVAEYRINPGKPFEEGYFTPYTAEQQRNAIETGYDLARNLYRPHITLTRYKEGEVPDRFPALPEAELSFKPSKICVYKANDNGAVYELIKEFKVD